MVFQSFLVFIKNSLASCSELDYPSSQESDMDIMVFIFLLCADEPRALNTVKVFIQGYAQRAILNMWTFHSLLALYSVRRLVRNEILFFIFFYYSADFSDLTMMLIGYENQQVWFKESQIFFPHSSFQCDKFDILPTPLSLCRASGLLVIFQTWAGATQGFLQGHMLFWMLI